MKIEIEDSLWAKVKKFSEAAGYSSPLEFVQQAVEKQMAASASPDEERDAAGKLKGIGYLDFGRDI
jgi:metal-responsive CopG/Arc/MetJ family transcriptional regulator